MRHPACSLAVLFTKMLYKFLPHFCVWVVFVNGWHINVYMSNSKMAPFQYMYVKTVDGLYPKSKLPDPRGALFQVVCHALADYHTDDSMCSRCLSTRGDQGPMSTSMVLRWQLARPVQVQCTLVGHAHKLIVGVACLDSKFKPWNKISNLWNCIGWWYSFVQALGAHYSIAGHFWMVQIFVHFVWSLETQK